jgi:tetratricopeptide (TPR) repeat protein
MQKTLQTLLIWPLMLWLSFCLPGLAETSQAVLQSEIEKGIVPASAEQKGTVPYSLHENRDSPQENRGSPQKCEQKGTVPFSLHENRDSPQENGDSPQKCEQKGTVPFSLHENRDSPQENRGSHITVPIYETPLSVLEKRLFTNAADGRLDDFSLLDAALIASGVDNSDELGRYRGRMAAWAEELKSSGGLNGSPRRQIEAIFDFLHSKILHGKYNIKCTDVRKALDEGRFNCVSATVLFNCLVGKLGFSSSALETPGHALSRVLLPDGPLDVETTCPRWFCMQRNQILNNGEKKEAVSFTPAVQTERLENRDVTRISDNHRKAVQKETVPFSLHENRDSPQLRENSDGPQQTIGQKPAKDKTILREISPVQLTAMIYYNRGIDFLAEKRFAEAAAANAKALRLDPLSSTARGNFLATINNWAIDMGDAGDYAGAADLLRQGLAFDPHYEAFSLNFAHVHYQWSQKLCKEGKYAEAAELLNRTASEMPDNVYFRKAAWDVYRRWALALFEAGKVNEAFDILQFMN